MAARKLHLTPAQHRTLHLINAGYSATVLPKVRGKFRTPSTNTEILTPEGKTHSYTGETTVQRLHEYGLIALVGNVYCKLPAPSSESDDHAIDTVHTPE